MPSWGCKGPGWDRDARVNGGRARVGAGRGGWERQGPASPQDAPWGHKPRPYTLTHTHAHRGRGKVILCPFEFSGWTNNRSMSARVTGKIPFLATSPLEATRLDSTHSVPVTAERFARQRRYG